MEGRGWTAKKKGGGFGSHMLIFSDRGMVPSLWTIWHKQMLPHKW